MSYGLNSLNGDYTRGGIYGGLFKGDTRTMRLDYCLAYSSHGFGDLWLNIGLHMFWDLGALQHGLVAR